jgi:murein DD-endopeptidase MepM/ murein hydrolase activator NlpD
MPKRFLVGALGALAVVAQAHAQIIEIPRETGSGPAARPIANAEALKAQVRPDSSARVQPAKSSTREPDSSSATLTIEQMRKAGALAAQQLKKEIHAEQSIGARVANSQTSRTEVTAYRPLDRQLRQSESIPTQSVTLQTETAFTRLANGFDFPVGKPDAQGYYKARGFRTHGHLGEDWDGVRGGDTDLGDPIFCIGGGVVVFARDCHMGWGNVVIVRHTYREGGTIKNIDSLYAHLDRILVQRGQGVSRGEKIATMGTAHGLYDAHLHLEIRKNIEIGMSRASFARDYSNYYDPTQFILSHRHLQTGNGTYRVAMNTFTHDAKINFARARNFSHSRDRGGSSESASALKKALASQH